jgi:hypothetical protein
MEWEFGKIKPGSICIHGRGKWCLECANLVAISYGGLALCPHGCVGGYRCYACYDLYGQLVLMPPLFTETKEEKEMTWVPDPLNVHEVFDRFGEFNFQVKVVEGHDGKEPRFDICVGVLDPYMRSGGLVTIAGGGVTKAQAFARIRTFIEEAKKLYSILNDLEEKFGRHE